MAADVSVFSYVVRYDFGFAPNPYHGWCSLGTCHEDFRARVNVGDWVVGTGSVAYDLAGRLVYAMKVEEVVTFETYWADPRFRAKRPVRRGSMRQRYGDNIYRRDADGDWVQEDSRHSLDDGTPNRDHIAKDTAANTVLLSRDFVYYGGNALDIPDRFRAWEGPRWNGNRFDETSNTTYDLCHQHPSYRRHFPDGFVTAVNDWLRGLIDDEEPPLRGDPAGWGV